MNGATQRFRFGWHTLLVGVLIWLLPSMASASLDAAYQREFAFLEAEKHSLQRRLAAHEQEAEQKLAAARAEVDQLQGRVLNLSLQADRMTDMLSEVERQADSASEDEDLITTLLSQAQTTLEQGNVAFPELPAQPEPNAPDAKLGQVQFAFDSGLKLLNAFSTVRQQPGEFFAPDGEKVAGTIIHVGRVGGYGISERASGTLAPAGEGKLRVWPGGDTSTLARSLSDGSAPTMLSLFLYESLEKGVEPKQDKTALQVIESGGAIGWVIVAIGLLALLMVIARALLLWRAASNTTQLAQKITPLLEQKHFSEAIAVCRSAKSAGGRVLVATLTHLDRERDELEDVISEAILHEQPALDRFGSLIIVVAAVAPLLGLLGTVTGMIATFDIITEFGTGNPKLLSGGISIALVTTELGLIVAIPALIFGNLLSGWADSIKDGMDKAALRVVNVSSGIRLTERPPSAPPAAIREEPALAAT